MKNNASVTRNVASPEPDVDRSRERILKSAEELFIERGFDGVSVNDVAVRANVAKGLVFYYYENKKNLFDTVLDRYYADQAAALMTTITSDGSIQDRIHAGIDAYLDFVEMNPGYPRLIQREICSGAQNMEKVMQYMLPLQRWGEAAFGALFPAGGHLSPRHFFITVFGMAINYYTYMPVIEELWKTDPATTEALAERRKHIHFVIDTFLSQFKNGKLI